MLGQAPPRPVAVPRRCHAGASFGVVVGRDTPRAETVVPGANPCIEPLPPGTRVFEVLAPTAPLLAVEKEAQEGARVRGVRRWEVVGQLQRWRSWFCQWWFWLVQRVPILSDICSI